MELQVGVKALLRNRESKFLLVKRSPVKYPEVPDRWDLVGGRINPGETLLENLRREIKEETNLDLTDEPRLVAAQDIIVPEHPDRHVVRLTYVGRIDGTPKLDDDHTEYGWFSMEEMKKLESLDVFLRSLLKDGIIKDAG